jgi:hypothetical protein
MAGIDQTLSNAINGINSAVTGLNTGVNSLANPNNGNDDTNNGFTVPGVPLADGDGLPSSHQQYGLLAERQRNLISFFIPEFGVIKMYVNPNNLVISNKKIISKERTKGGYTVQYWGEELTDISLRGTTGSSGIEGINVLYEIYRAEQYAFDAVGLSLAANNAAIGAANQLVTGVGNSIGSAAGNVIGGAFGAGGNSIGGDIGGLLGSGIAQGIFGTNQLNSLAPRNIPSLASLAFAVEMYYSGWVYRGWFESMVVTESSEHFSLFEYDIRFTASQRRGYRTNSFAFQRSAISGPSNNDGAGGIPLTFSQLSNNT